MYKVQTDYYQRKRLLAEQANFFSYPVIEAVTWIHSDHDDNDDDDNEWPTTEYMNTYCKAVFKCHESKTKAITSANYNRLKQYNKPMKIWSYYTLLV